MDRPSRVAQWYGYTVCLVAVVTGLLSINAVVGGAFTLTDPVRDERYGPSISSFEAYQATQDRGRMLVPADSSRRPALSEAEQRSRFAALKADQIGRSRFEAMRSIVTSGILLVVALALFIGHWHWLHRQTLAANAGPGPGVAAA